LSRVNFKKLKEKVMSQESQKIAALRDQMDRIDENPLAAVKGAWNAGKAGVQAAKNFAQGAKAGMQGSGAASKVASDISRSGIAANKGLAAAQAVKNTGQAVAGQAGNIAKVGAGGVAGGAAVGAMSDGGAATKPADATAPATASNLDPKEQAELATLIKEFDPMMGQSPELDALITQATKLAGGNAELDAVIKNAGVAKPAAAPAAAPAPGAATKPAAAPAPTTTATNTSTAVSGEMKMGQPSGPITYNGKTVNPGEPEYAAASAALMKSQDKMNTARTQRTAPQPVVPGAPNTTTTKSGVTVSNWG
jgi:hypothetical protein